MRTSPKTGGFRVAQPEQAEEDVSPLLGPLLDMDALMNAQLHHHKFGQSPVSEDQAAPVLGLPAKRFGYLQFRASHHLTRCEEMTCCGIHIAPY